MEENLKRDRKKYLHEWRLYEDNISRLYQNRKQIIQNEKMFFATTPLNIYTIPHPVYLGAIVRVWDEYRNIFSAVCPTCGDRTLIFSFTVSPMTGSSSRSEICLGCGRKNISRSSDFNILAGTLRSIAEQYIAKQMVGYTMEEIIEILNS